MLRLDGLSLHVGSHQMCQVSVAYPAATDEAPYGCLMLRTNTSACCSSIFGPVMQLSFALLATLLCLQHSLTLGMEGNVIILPRAYAIRMCSCAL